MLSYSPILRSVIKMTHMNVCCCDEPQKRTTRDSSADLHSYTPTSCFFFLEGTGNLKPVEISHTTVRAVL